MSDAKGLGFESSVTRPLNFSFFSGVKPGRWHGAGGRVGGVPRVQEEELPQGGREPSRIIIIAVNPPTKRRRSGPTNHVHGKIQQLLLQAGNRSLCNALPRPARPRLSAPPGAPEPEHQRRLQLQGGSFKWYGQRLGDAGPVGGVAAQRRAACQAVPGRRLRLLLRPRRTGSAIDEHE